jgi:RNA polymerase sigma-70 factor (ECF subfamily)
LPAWLRPKFDSVDIVQSVWADLLNGFRDAGWRIRDAAHLRAFLVKVTRNRFIDRYRQHRHAREREQRLSECSPAQAPVAADPRPSDEARADELWQQMLALCPPEHHELLRLKRQGLSLDEIAAPTGLHPSSVRRILYELARRMAIRKKAEAPET